MPICICIENNWLEIHVVSSVKINLTFYETSACLNLNCFGENKGVNKSHNKVTWYIKAKSKWAKSSEINPTYLDILSLFTARIFKQLQTSAEHNSCFERWMNATVSFLRPVNKWTSNCTRCWNENTKGINNSSWKRGRIFSPPKHAEVGVANKLKFGGCIHGGPPEYQISIDGLIFGQNSSYVLENLFILFWLFFFTSTEPSVLK